MGRVRSIREALANTTKHSTQTRSSAVEVLGAEKVVLLPHRCRRACASGARRGRLKVRLDSPEPCFLFLTLVFVSSLTAAFGQVVSSSADPRRACRPLLQSFSSS